MIIPGIDSGALLEFAPTSGIFGLYDMFAGGNFSKATIFALGIMPYISAQIILQLLGSVMPYFQRLQKEGREGQNKINQYSRYGTVLLAAAQSLGLAVYWQNIGEGRVVPHSGPVFTLLTMLTITAGTVLIMWLGEQITERGIGNGISLIIFIGIVADFPYALKEEFNYFRINDKGIIPELLLCALLVGVVGMVVLLTQGQRRIPIQFAKKIVGRRIYGGQSTHLPMKINVAGVIPIIFTQAIMFLPSTVGTFFQGNEFISWLMEFFETDSPFYWFLYGLMIVFFTYFYAAIVFNPVDTADNLKSRSGFIPGIRPGKRTAEYIDQILTRITLPGALFLAAIAIFPFFVTKSMNVAQKFAQFFGGTGLLIIVGVALDTLQQVESHLLMRHYDGFMKKGRLKGRR